MLQRRRAAQAASRRRAFGTDGSAARPRQRPRTDISQRRPGRDRDLLARRRVTTLASLLSGLETHRQLHQLTNPGLLRVPRGIEHDLIQRIERPLRVSRAQLRTISESRHELCLRKSHDTLPG